MHTLVDQMVQQGLIDESAESHFTLMQQIVGAVREVRNTHKVAPKRKLACSISAGADDADRLPALRELIETLAGVELGEVGPDTGKPDDAVASVVGDTEVYVHGLVDVDAERGRLTKRFEELEKSRGALQGRLNNKGYVEKAPAHLVQQTRDQLAEVEREMQAVRDMLADGG